MSIEAMKQALEHMEWSTPQGREAYWGLVKAIAEAEQKREWVGLTDEEMYKLWLGTDERMERIAFGKAVQAKLKEKNT